MDSLQGMLHLMVMSSTDQDSSSQQDMDTLNQQAEILLPVSSSISIVSKDVSLCHSGLFPSPSSWASSLDFQSRSATDKQGKTLGTRLDYLESLDVRQLCFFLYI